MADQERVNGRPCLRLFRLEQEAGVRDLKPGDLVKAGLLEARRQVIEARHLDDDVQVIRRTPRDAEGQPGPGAPRSSTRVHVCSRTQGVRFWKALISLKPSEKLVGVFG